MEQHPLFGKRKKPKPMCPNPLFVHWLTEWRDEAAEKGWKSQYTYGKALSTLKKFPLLLTSGKECKILENFGDKICKMLDDKLTEYVAVHGTTAPVGISTSVTSSNFRTKPSQSKPRKQSDTSSQRIATSSGEGSIPAAVDLGTANVAAEMDSSEEEEPDPPKKRRKSGQRSGEREYIPVYRSGPYAILVTLYRDMQNPNSRGFMTRAELIQAAQPLADKSFTIPDPGCRYTTWSSMGTLIKKGLVIKESSPAKYSLTDAGCQLAHRLELVGGADNPQGGAVPFRLHQNLAPAAVNPLAQAAPPLPTMLPGSVSEEEDHELNMHVPSFPSFAGIGTSNERMRYWYVTDEGREVLQKDKAAVTIDEEISIGFLVKCNYQELLQSGFRYKLDTSRTHVQESYCHDPSIVCVDTQVKFALYGNLPYDLAATRPLGDDFVYAYLHNDDAAEFCTSPHDHSTSARGDNFMEQQGSLAGSSSWEPPDTGLPGVKKKIKIRDDNKKKRETKPTKPKSTEPQLLPLINSLSKLSGPVSTCNGVEKTELVSDLVNGHSNQIISVESGESSNDSLPSIGSNFCPPFRSAPAPNSQESSMSSLQSSQNSIQSLSSVSSVRSLPKPDFVLKPGEFEIIICIDNQEFYGSKSSSKNMLPDLIKNGVECDLRKLHVGDILWVAREKLPLIPGQLARPQGRELVLDYIIERKRLDDLVGSIIDGRFKEQKFRLKRCGLRRPMYLVEEYGSLEHFSIPEKTIRQAITNTQVIDGFQVKWTKNAKETVAFLTVMTRYLQSYFMGKTLYSCSLEESREFGNTYDINDPEQRLVMFPEFNEGSIKTKALTVREMFARQLIQFHGMSADKAKAITDRYPTPTQADPLRTLVLTGPLLNGSLRKLAEFFSVSLFSAYDSCGSEKEKENLLLNIKAGKSGRSLGATQSRQIYQLYCSSEPLT